MTWGGEMDEEGVRSAIADLRERMGNMEAERDDLHRRLVELEKDRLPLQSYQLPAGMMGLLPRKPTGGGE
jgi:hypothetical protein